MTVSALQNKLSQQAANPDYRFDALFGYIADPRLLRLAYERIAKNSGARTPGCDGVTIQTFAKRLDANLENLAFALEEGSYRAEPLRQVIIPKADGSPRTLGIPVIRDRIVQEAIRQVLNPIFEAGFSSHSFGYRHNLSVNDAAAAVRRYAQQGRCWVLDADIRACFDSLDHGILIGLLRKRLADERLLGLIQQFLSAGLMAGNRRQTLHCGAPQGAIISPLLANIYLHVLDRFVEHAYASDIGYVRYADDFVVMATSKRQARDIQQAIAALLHSALELDLSTEKTSLKHLRQGLDFLGFTICKPLLREHVRVDIPVTAVLATEQKAAQLLQQQPPRVALAQLNRYLASWGGVYRHCDNAHHVFRRLDTTVQRRLLRSLANYYGQSLAKTRRQHLHKGALQIEGLELRRLSEVASRPTALPAATT